ncbi:MAG TPA: glycosyltransferase family 4 protein [Thermoanaerobaculia bacterium]|nr:glycosyltransferase family 4 protein [Thermoanaerobaculia bacterium]
MKILLATSRYPWPPRRGDQIRAVQALDILAPEHEVTLLTPETPGGPPPPSNAPYRVELYRPVRTALTAGLARVLARGLPLQSALFYQPDLGRRLRELAPQADLGILQLVRLAVHLDDFGTTPILADLIDSLALNTARRAEVDHPLLRPALRYEAHRLDKAERRLAERAAGVLLVCERDRQDLIKRLPPDLGKKVAVVRIAVGPHPVPEKSSEAAPLLAITGNLGYFVNVDAVTWWLRDVWPALHKVRPDIRVVIAGDRPSGAVRRAAKKAGVELIESPPDLRSIIAKASIALAPMRCGSGVPIKILEAWAVGTPVVATPWAAAGTTGKPGEDLLVAGPHPAEWASAIRELLDDPPARARLAENGRRRLASDYSAEVVRGQLLRAVETPDAR